MGCKSNSVQTIMRTIKRMKKTLAAGGESGKKTDTLNSTNRASWVPGVEKKEISAT